MGILLKIFGYIFTAIFVVFVLSVFILSLPISGWRGLSVQTGSMRPLIDPGALVLVHRVPVSAFHVGDVITYNSSLVPGETITHRIVAIKGTYKSKEIIVKGDANKIADPPIVPNQVVGKVVKSVPHLGHVVNALHTPIGLILIVYIPAIILVAYEIKLLVQRLTRLEVAKREGQSAGDNPRSSFQPKPMPAMAQSQQAATATIKQPATVAPIERDDIPAVVHTHRVVRSIDGIRVVFAIVIMTFVVGSTFASLQSTAKLTGNSITVTFPNN